MPVSTSQKVTQPPATGCQESSLASAPSSRIGELDGLRGLAALAVVFFHVMSRMHPQLREGGGFVATCFSQYGQDAVIAFFVISGFLISRPIMAALLHDRPWDFRRYVIARCMRIFPLWWLVLGVSLALFHAPAGTDPRSLALLISLQQNYDSQLVKAVVSPAWSLVIELSFYALAPAIMYGVLLIFGRRIRARWLVAGTITAVFVAISFRAYRYSLPNQPGPDRDALTWSLLPWLDSFAVGALVAIISLVVVRRSGKRVQWICLITACVCFVATAQFLVIREDALQRTGVAVSFALLILGCVLTQHGPVSRLLTAAPLLHAGRLCYGVYLWHMVVIHGLQQTTHLLTPSGITAWLGVSTLVAAASILLAEISWYGLEQPAINWVRRRQHGRKSANAGMLAA